MDTALLQQCDPSDAGGHVTATAHHRDADQEPRDAENNSGKGTRMTRKHELDGSVRGARDAAERGELGHWVAGFLASAGSDNAALAASLQSEMEFWHGPISLPFKQLHRLAGPANQPTLTRLGEDDLETVEEMEEGIDEGWAPPPFIVSLNEGHLVLEDGNHRIEALRRSGKREYWSVIGFRDAEERDRFLENWEEG